MKFSELWLLLNTDDFWITIDDDIETTVHIEGTAEGSFREMAAFLSYTVKRITPVSSGIEIDLSSK